MTMKERIDKAKTKCSEKKPQETELKNDKLSNNKIKGEKRLEAYQKNQSSKHKARDDDFEI
ncbi:hypothetical protein [Lactococcus lactis]|uniref:hypothetical protein n=1 Tax=Lactococcus lactis TaxID=1358 RepID=UPI0035A708F8